jgi:transposase
VGDTMPARLVMQWEDAYRQYGAAFDHATRQEAGDPQAAEAVASASWQIAGVWRDMATAVPLPWWLLAALRAAADAFETQAHGWHVRAVHAQGTSSQRQPPGERRGYRRPG